MSYATFALGLILWVVQHPHPIIGTLAMVLGTLVFIKDRTPIRIDLRCPRCGEQI